MGAAVPKATQGVGKYGEHRARQLPQGSGEIRDTESDSESACGAGGFGRSHPRAGRMCCRFLTYYCSIKGVVCQHIRDYCMAICREAGAFFSSFGSVSFNTPSAYWALILSFAMPFKSKLLE